MSKHLLNNCFCHKLRWWVLLPFSSFFRRLIYYSCFQYHKMLMVSFIKNISRKSSNFLKSLFPTHLNLCSFCYLLFHIVFFCECLCRSSLSSCMQTQWEFSHVTAYNDKHLCVFVSLLNINMDSCVSQITSQMQQWVAGSMVNTKRKI